LPFVSFGNSDNVKVGEFKVETQSLSIGDEILIIGPTTGIIRSRVGELRLNDTKVNKVQRGDTMSMPIHEKIRPSDKLYKLVEA
jgi:putative protease